MYDWPDLWKLNVNDWMRRKRCRDVKWSKQECLHVTTGMLHRIEIASIKIIA